MAKETGIYRRVDELGRIVIPKNMRNALCIRDNDEVELTLQGESVVIVKKNESCVFCGSRDELIRNGGKAICRHCLTEMSKSL